MIREELIEYIRKPQLLDENSLGKIKEVVRSYPYFHTAHLLILKNLKDINDRYFADQLTFSSLYTVDRDKMFRVVHGYDPGAPEPENLQNVEGESDDKAVEDNYGAETQFSREKSFVGESRDFLEKNEEYSKEFVIKEEKCPEEQPVDEAHEEEPKEAQPLSETHAEEPKEEQPVDKAHEEDTRREQSGDKTHEEETKAEEISDKEDEKDEKTGADSEESLADKVLREIEDYRFRKLEKPSLYRQDVGNKDDNEDQSFLFDESEEIYNKVQPQSVSEQEDKEKDTEGGLLEFESGSSHLNEPGQESGETAEAAESESENTESETGDLIDKFLKNNPRIEPPADLPKEVEQVDISSESARESEEFFTETLAKVYLQQKHYNKAIYAYEKLSLKYPEKYSYFAKQIEEIKRIINEQK